MGVYGRKNYVSLSSIKLLFTRQPFLMPKGFIHGCRSFSIKVSLTPQLFSMKVHVFTRQSFLKQKKKQKKKRSYIR